MVECFQLCFLPVTYFLVSSFVVCYRVQFVEGEKLASWSRGKKYCFPTCLVNDTMSKFRVFHFAVVYSNVARMMKFAFYRMENILGREENAFHKPLYFPTIL